MAEVTFPRPFTTFTHSLSLFLLLPTHEALLWFFSFSTAPVSSSSLQKCISLSPPFTFPLTETKNITSNSPFYTNYTQKIPSAHLHTTYVVDTRRARAIWVFHALDFSRFRRHAALCCWLPPPSGGWRTLRGVRDQNSLGFSSLGRINITVGYVTCCYGDGDGLAIVFRETRRN